MQRDRTGPGKTAIGGAASGLDIERVGLISAHIDQRRGAKTCIGAAAEVGKTRGAFEVRGHAVQTWGGVVPGVDRRGVVEQSQIGGRGELWIAGKDRATSRVPALHDAVCHRGVTSRDCRAVINFGQLPQNIELIIVGWLPREVCHGPAIGRSIVVIKVTLVNVAELVTTPWNWNSASLLVIQPAAKTGGCIPVKATLVSVMLLR